MPKSPRRKKRACFGNVRASPIADMDERRQVRRVPAHLNLDAAVSKFVSSLVILAWVFTVLLWILGAFGIVVRWLDWGMSLDCIRGDLEYPCPTAFQALKSTAAIMAVLGVLTVIVGFVARRVQRRP